MQKFNIALVLFFSFAISNIVYSQSFHYVSPKNNLSYVSLQTNIILKSPQTVDPASLSPNEFAVTGSASGTHLGRVKLSDDNKTILFFPASPFSPNEKVSVQVNQGIKTTDGSTLQATSIHFTTTPLSKKINIPLRLLDEGSVSTAGITTTSTSGIQKPSRRISATDTLPSDFPPFTVDSSNNPASGNIFMTNLSLAPNPSIGYYLMILNNDGTPAKYRKLGEWGVDFKVQPNGKLSYAYVTEVLGTLVEGTYVVMDTTLTPLDTISVGNGYTTYPSDFLLLPNGHALLMGLEVEPYDMSPYGGSPNAEVVGDIIQEIDASKNVVFQWRTLDYIPITDSYVDLTTQTVDLIHANAFDVDQNGDIIFSMRHCSAVIKIDRQTGNIDWFLGGKENQFSFVNENESNSPNYFSFQHDVRWQPNGDITLFDNGNQHVPNYSRGVEYQLDQQNKIATLVWQYRHTPDIYAPAMGSVERLANGNTLIGWGEATAFPPYPLLLCLRKSIPMDLQHSNFRFRSAKYRTVSINYPG